MPMPSTVNPFHQDKWKINFSNIPSTTSFTDMPLYDLFVKSVTLPDVNITENYSNYKQYQIRHPSAKGNVDLSQLQVTFKASENLKNYYNLFTWMMNLRYGENITTSLIRKNVIDNINVILLDNQKVKQSIITFTDCSLLSLSSLSLEYGISDELLFTTNFSYQEVNHSIDVQTK